MILHESSLEFAVTAPAPSGTWQLLPLSGQARRFLLNHRDTGTVCTLTFPIRYNPKLLRLIAAAPELEDIAEMYRDEMLGSDRQHTMIFEIVSRVLHRLEEPSGRILPEEAFASKS